MEYSPEKHPSLELTLDDLDISVRAYQWLKNQVGVKTLGELSSKTETELKEIRGFTPKTLEEIKTILQEKNLSLAVD